MLHQYIGPPHSIIIGWNARKNASSPAPGTAKRLYHRQYFYGSSFIHLWQNAGASGGSPDRSAALTGSSVSALTWVVTPNTTVPIGGSSATVSSGTLIPTPQITLSGQSVTVSSGSLTPALTVTLAGNNTPIDIGTLSPTLTLPLSGSSLTGSAGTCSVNLSCLLSEPLVVVSAGTLTPSGGTPPAGSTVITFNGVSMTNETGVSTQLVHLVSLGGGQYTVTYLSGVSRNKDDSAVKETYLIDGAPV